MRWGCDRHNCSIGGIESTRVSASAPYASRAALDGELATAYSGPSGRRAVISPGLTRGATDKDVWSRRFIDMNVASSVLPRSRLHGIPRFSPARQRALPGPSLAVRHARSCLSSRGPSGSSH